MESFSTSEPLLLPPRSAPKASLPSSLDFKWCFSDGNPGCSYTIPLPGRIDVWIVDLESPLRKNPMGTLRATWEALPTRPCSYPARHQAGWLVKLGRPTALEPLEDIGVGALGIASFDMGFLMASFLLMGFLGFWSVWPSVISHRQGINTTLSCLFAPLCSDWTSTHTQFIQPPRQFPSNIAPLSCTYHFKYPPPKI